MERTKHFNAALKVVLAFKRLEGALIRLPLPSVTSVWRRGITLKCSVMRDDTSFSLVPAVVKANEKTSFLCLDSSQRSVCHARKLRVFLASATYQTTSKTLLTSLRQLHPQYIPQTMNFLHLLCLRNRVFSSQKTQFKPVITRSLHLLLAPKVWLRDRELPYSSTRRLQASLRMVDPRSWSSLPPSREVGRHCLGSSCPLAPLVTVPWEHMAGRWKSSRERVLYHSAQLTPRRSSNLQDQEP